LVWGKGRRPVYSSRRHHRTLTQMLIALIFLFNLLAVIIAFFLKWRGIRTAYIWFFLVFVCLSVWLLLLLIPIDRINPLVIPNWFTIGSIPINLQFRITIQNWPLAFSIITFIFSFFLTGIARLDIRKDLSLWAIQIIFGVFSFLAILSADLWTVILFWTALDFIDIFFKLVILKTADRKLMLRSLSIRFLGSLILIWNTSSISRLGINPTLEVLRGIGRNDLFLAALLHSGILPFQSSGIPKSDSKTENIINASIVITNFAVSSSLIIYLPSPDLFFFVNIGLIILLYILLLIFSFSWALGTGAEYSIKNLLSLAACFISYFFIIGSDRPLIFWMNIFLLPMLMLWLYSHRSRSTRIFPALMVLLISGLPFSLNANSARGLFISGFNLSEIVLIIPHILILAGVLKRILEKGEDFHLMESWYQAVYLLGLFLPVLSIGAISFRNLSDFSLELQYWWIGGGVLISAFAFYYLFNRKISKDNPVHPIGETSVINRFFSMNWIFSLTLEFEKRISKIVTGFSGLLEGEGGILWALVFLLLILTVFR